MRRRRRRGLRTHARLRHAARPRQVPATSRPRQVQEHLQRVLHIVQGGRPPQPRQGLGAHPHRLLAPGCRQILRLRILQIQIRDHGRRGVGISVPDVPVPSCVGVRGAHRRLLSGAVRGDQSEDANHTRLHVTDEEGHASYAGDGGVRRVLQGPHAAVGAASAVHHDEVFLLREDVGVPVRERGAEAEGGVHEGGAAGADVHRRVHCGCAVRYSVASFGHDRVEAEQRPERDDRRDSFRGGHGGDLAGAGGAYRDDRHADGAAVVRVRRVQGVHKDAAPAARGHAGVAQEEVGGREVGAQKLPSARPTLLYHVCKLISGKSRSLMCYFNLYFILCSLLLKFFIDIFLQFEYFTYRLTIEQA